MEMVPSVTASLFLALSLSCSAQAEQPDAGRYHVSREIKLGGDGFWDYLTADSTTRRLYVSHSKVMLVLDLDTGELVGEIKGLNGVHGIAVVADAGRGFASNGRDNSVSIVDLKTLQVTGHIAAGRNPDAIIYDPASRRVLAFNHSGGDVTVIDPEKGTADATIQIGGDLEYAVSDGTGSVFVNVEDKNEIVKIDTSTNKVVARWPLAPCEEPSGLALDRQSHRLFANCGNAMLIVVDADDGHVVAHVPIGLGSDGVRFDPATGLIFVSNGEGSMSILHQDSADIYRPMASVPTRRGARTLEIDLATHKVFTATAELGPAPKAAQGVRPRPTVLPDSFMLLELAPGD